MNTAAKELKLDLETRITDLYNELATYETNSSSWRGVVHHLSKTCKEYDELVETVEEYEKGEW